MNITDNLIRIKEGKEQIIQSLKNKGVEISDNTLINEIPTIIDNAEIGGGGGDTPSVPTELVQKYEGATVFRINIPTDNYEFAINLCDNANSATYDVDWGDGSLESGLTTDEQHHIYSKSGIYDVNVYNLSREITLGIKKQYTNTVNSELYTLFNNSNNDYWENGSYYGKNDADVIERIILGDKISTSTAPMLANCNNLKSIQVTKNVTSLGNNYFDSLPCIEIIIPDTIQNFGSSVFQNCSKLLTITLPSQIKSIPNYTFNQAGIQTITIPSNVTSIGGSNFNSSLCIIKSLPMTAPTITSSSFPTGGAGKYLYVPKDSVGYDEGNWKTYLLDKNWELRYIEDYEKTPTILKLKTKNNFLNKVNYCNGVKCVDYELVDDVYTYYFEDKIRRIDKKVFNNFSFKNIELPEGVEYLGDSIFSQSLLLDITLPNSLKYISDSCFSNTDLTSIIIPNNVTVIGASCFYNCNYLTSISIPNSVTSIGKSCFYRVPITTITLPSNLTTITQELCSECTSLTSIEIPENVTSIENKAFYYCSKLSTITCKAMTAPTITSSTFSYLGQNIPSGTPKVLRVPEGAEGYDSGNWKTYVLDKGYTLEYFKL